MTTQYLIEKFVERNHLHYIKGDTTDIAPLMPFFIMDIGYQYYCHDIKKLPLHREMKLAVNKWRDSYSAFNRRLLTTYRDIDERIFLGDMMDEMHEYLANDLMRLQVAGMNVFANEYTFPQQQVLSSSLMTNKLAVIAQYYWRSLYSGHDCREIDGVMQWSRQFSDLYLASFGEKECKVKERTMKNLEDCTNALVDKLTEWLDEKNGFKGTDKG